MTDGVQRVCPKCAELNNPNSAICSQCGAWLIEPEHLDDEHLADVLEDWRKTWLALGVRIKRGDTSHGAAADTAQKHRRGGPG
jgi:hypothetical protein